MSVKEKICFKFSSNQFSVKRYIKKQETIVSRFYTYKTIL